MRFRSIIVAVAAVLAPFLSDELGAIQLKPLDTISNKWKTRASGAGADYAAGIAAPKVDWAGATAAGAEAYAQGVQEAIGQGRFQREVRKAGSAKWQSRASTLGAQRFPQGVNASQADYSSGVAPYLQVISQVSLPAKGPRGAPQNLERVRAVTDALHQRRIAGGTS